MTVKADDKVVMEEKTALSIENNKTIQTLKQNEFEQFYGGGTQNGRIVHTGKAINIANESGWNDGQVSSPAPFYYTTNGYGVLRNTFQQGGYDFGAAEPGTVTARHNEKEFDAYYFVSDETNGRKVVQDLLQGYFKVAGNPALLPEYGFYVGHLNAYNRDAWSSTTDIGSNWTIKGNAAYDSQGTTTYEAGGTGYKVKDGDSAETLNGYGPTVATDQVPNVTYSEEFSARAVLDEYQQYDMPFGYFLPNDGYGAGYGQNGYNMTGGVNADGSSSEERLEAVAANVANLKDFADYAKEKGVATGLWTQSNLTPDSNPDTYWHLLRDFENEVKAGVTTLKTDVAWVGPGYSFQLNGVKQAYDIVTTTKYEDGRANTRPNIISLDGWAGSQRYNSVWTGDQYGGSWEYIRFHIPTFIGQSLSGNPNIGSDMDGIWGGNPVIATRDYQWKSFAPQMLDMDGWGSYAKGPYVHGDPYTGVSRMYLKLKAQLLPYIYTNAYAAANIETGNDDTGLPMVRAMFLEYPEEGLAYGDASKYQYMWGENMLVAPLYQNTNADEMGNDIRNNIYLPGGEETIWIDYFTGEQYRGGQVLNNFDAPLWKLPLFVKNGAIIPMWEENNSPDDIDRANRIVEFWPAGSSDFTVIEDDGTFIENNIENDAEYGAIDNISYGDHVSTKYTSEVKNGTATITAEKSTGSYDGYEAKKNTTFVVNATDYETVTAYNGDKKLENVTVDSKEVFEKSTPEAGKAVVFYDKTPVINTYASAEETKIAEMVADVEVSGKLYVKFANTNSQENTQTLVIEGFANDGDLGAYELNESLEVPTLAEVEDLKTPDSITLQWNAIEGATSYEVEADGVINKILAGTTFTHSQLVYNTAHSYKVRVVTPEGYSNWSNVVNTKTAEDPWLLSPSPVSVDWPAGIYGSNKATNAFNHVYEQGDAGFHSGSSGDAYENALTADFGTGYLFDKIEYTHRPSGNGVVSKMRVSTSLDGKHWVDQDFNLSAHDHVGEMPTDVLDLSNPSSGADAIAARYIRFQVLQSVGGFFHASELKPITVEAELPGSALRPFTPGNITTGGNQAMTLANFQTIYQKESSAHKSIKSPQWQGEIQNVGGDINFNDMSDVYDYAFYASQVDGGTKKTGKVSGAILLATNKNSVKAGEEFTVDVMTVDAKNVNAYGTVINYDPALVEYVGVDYIGTETMFTQGMTGNIIYDDGTAYVNHNAVNMGDKKLINGSKLLSSVTMRAKADIDLTDKNTIDLTTATMVGPDCSTVVTDTSKAPEIPETPSTTTIEYKQSDFNITMTNDVLTEDDGTNVEAIVQTGTYDALFNDVYANREFEFKWYIPSQNNKLPDEVKLPTTLHFELKSPKPMSNVVIYNDAPTSNGYVKKLEAVVTYKDGTTQEYAVEDAGAEIVLAIDDTKVVTNIDITPLESTGVASTSGADVVNVPAENRMLTWNEIDFLYTTGVDVEAIAPAEDNATSVFVGYLTDVKAVITPENATNAYYKVESSDPSVASIVCFADENGEPVYKVRGVNAGTATIKLIAAADDSITAEYEITVVAGVDKTDLLAAIEKYGKVTSEIYTPESFAPFKEAYDAAVAVNANSEATRKDVDVAVTNLEVAYAGLKAVLVDPSKKLDVSIIAGAEGLYSEDNVAMNMFDCDLTTYWESPYGGPNAKLPQSVVVTLNEPTILEQLSFISHTIQNGGVTEYTVAVSLDGTTWVDVAAGSVDADEYKQGNNVTVNARFAAVNAQYIKLTVLGAVGRIPAEDNMYGRITEMELYGEKEEVSKTILDYAITLAEKISEEDLEGCVDAVVEYFNKALANAKAVQANEFATKDEVTEAWTTLFDAMHKLDWKKADVSDLKDFVAYADTLVKEEYYEKGWAEFEEALAAAKELIADGNNMDQEAVNEALKELMEAASELRNIPDKSELEDLITKVEGMKAEDYTAESWAAFEAALANAKAVYKAESVQSEVDAAITALNTAIDNLKSADAGTGNGNASGGNTGSGTGTGTGNGAGTGTDTGDSTNVAGLAFLLMLSASAMAIAKSKKRS